VGVVVVKSWGSDRERELVKVVVLWPTGGSGDRGVVVVVMARGGEGSN
jgi:hypothetical protein